MVVEFKGKVNERQLAAFQRRMFVAPKAVFDDIEVRWNEDGLNFISDFRTSHLSGKPITLAHARRVRSPATPYNVLTRISGALYSSFAHKTTRPHGNVKTRLGVLQAAKGKSLRDILSYARIHKDRMQFVPSVKFYVPIFVRSAAKALEKA